MSYLMDAICQIATLCDDDRVTSIIPDTAKRLVGTPRFLLDEAATRTVAELTVGRPKVLHQALANLRIPYRRLWVEWPEAARELLRQSFTTDNFVRPDRPIPQRVGFLLEAEHNGAWNGRSGYVTWAWASKEIYPVPNISPMQAHFDLDHQFPQRNLRHNISALTNNLGALWQDHQVQYEALRAIWHHVEHIPSEWGRMFLHGATEAQLDNTMADVFGEWITVLAVMLLLTATRPVINLTPIDLGKLNKHRIKKRQVPLLDYTSVTLKLQPPNPQYNPIVRGPLGHARKSPRVHLVSSYLARRGDKHWVCQPYWRGKGEVIHRRINVKG